MTRKDSLPKPTDSELAILRVLWKQGPSSVREVQEVLSRERPTGYTTALKLLQIMYEKGLVKRSEMARAHVYSAVPTEQGAVQRLVTDLVDKAFNGSAQQLVMHALSSRKTSPEELAEIRKLLDELEENQA
jgi:predicted transcriptional regulator